MRIRLLGGLNVEHDGWAVTVTGGMQLAVLFRLAVDAGCAVSYRAIAEDIWAAGEPENRRAALQSIVSRLRSQLPPGSIESTTGGYRLVLSRPDVDALAFEDLVAAADAATSDEDARRYSTEALALWRGEPWVPSADFDWFVRDLVRDRARALKLGGSVAPAVSPASFSATSRTAIPRIPVPLTALVGREHELVGIGEQLAISRLVTIVGTGGAGKTRLALEAARGIRGAFLVELAPVGPGEVLAAVLAATGRDLRTTEVPMEPVGSMERVIEALYGRDVVLLLDNCEHVIDAAAELAERLLSGLPGLRILATSREPLGIPGESFVTVGPLPHPADDDLKSDQLPGFLREFAAVELLNQRAIAARGSGLTVAELVTAGRICARLDGLPLAVELAAAKLRTMSVEEVLLGLDSRFTLLTGGYRTALPRHQTLRAMIDWSWSLLSADERTALAWIAVFPAGVDARESADVAGVARLPTSAVFDALVDKSLFHRERGRYRMLETIREYGIERLGERGTLADKRRSQAEYMAERAAKADVLLRGPGIHEAIAWFDAEDDNVVAALRYATSAGLARLSVALVTACAWYWTIRDRHDDAGSWFRTVCELATEVDTDEARAILLFAPFLREDEVGRREENRIDRTAEVLQGAFKAWSAAPPARGSELMQLVLPLLTAFSELTGRTDRMLQARVPRGEELGLDPWPCAVLHVVRAAMAQNRGDVAELGEASYRAVRAFEANGDLWGLSIAQQMRGEWLSLQGRLDEALLTIDESTANMSRIAASWDLAQQQALAVSILVRRGFPAEARARSMALLAAAAEDGNILTVIQSEITALLLDVRDGDVDGARARMSRIDSTAATWPSMPGQLLAGIELARAGLAQLDGDLGAAERAIRTAADAAIATMDHPVIGRVALAVGSLALARGDIADAVRALDLSSAIVGVYDRLTPEAVAIESAAIVAGVGRGGVVTTPRPLAVDMLRRLVDEKPSA